MIAFGVLLGSYFLAAAFVGEYFAHNLPLTALLTLAVAFAFIRRDKISWVLVGIALVMVADIAVIFLRNGMEMGYFRSPMESDPERNVALVNSLLRDGMSPFFPSPINYQTTWHHGVAAITTYPVSAMTVDVFSLFTAFSFFFVLVSFIKEKKEWSIALVALLVIAFAHADIYNLVVHHAIEADGGIGDRRYRMFSAKLAAVTSPQHILFCTFFILLIRTKGEKYLEHFFAVLCVVTSPILSAMTLPGLYIGHAIYGDWKQEIKLASISALTGLAVYLAIYQQFPIDLSGQGLKYFEMKKFGYLLTIWVASLGALGIVLTYAIWRQSFYAVLLIGFFLFFNFVVQDIGVEIKRHYAIAASTIGLLFLASIDWSRTIRYLLVIAAVVAVPAHAFFLYRFTAGPNIVQSSFTDYQCMNKYLAGNPMPVVAASGELRFPPAAQVTTVFHPIREDVLVHTRLTDEDREFVKGKSFTYKTVLLNDHHGYTGFILGPYERKSWGKMTRRLTKNQLLHTCGEVGLYRFSERRHLIRPLPPAHTSSALTPIPSAQAAFLSTLLPTS